MLISCANGVRKSCRDSIHLCIKHCLYWLAWHHLSRLSLLFLLPSLFLVRCTNFFLSAISSGSNVDSDPRRSQWLSTSTNWIFGYAVVQLAPIMISTISWRTYFVFSCFKVAFIPLVYFTFPETNGYKLETLMRSSKLPIACNEIESGRKRLSKNKVEVQLLETAQMWKNQKRGQSSKKNLRRATDD